LISLIPPSYQDLENRLRGRALDTDKTITKRLSESKIEVSKCLTFDFLILNDDFEKALMDLKDIIFKKLNPKEFNSRVTNDLLKNLLD
jgi:guanylate kinase